MAVAPAAPAAAVGGDAAAVGCSDSTGVFNLITNASQRVRFSLPRRSPGRVREQLGILNELVDLREISLLRVPRQVRPPERSTERFSPCVDRVNGILLQKPPGPGIGYNLFFFVISGIGASSFDHSVEPGGGSSRCCRCRSAPVTALPLPLMARIPPRWYYAASGGRWQVVADPNGPGRTRDIQARLTLGEEPGHLWVSGSDDPLIVPVPPRRGLRPLPDPLARVDDRHTHGDCWLHRMPVQGIHPLDPSAFADVAARQLLGAARRQRGTASPFREAVRTGVLAAGTPPTAAILARWRR